jgi:hypothetical protein
MGCRSFRLWQPHCEMPWMFGSAIVVLEISSSRTSLDRTGRIAPFPEVAVEAWSYKRDSLAAGLAFLMRTAPIGRPQCAACVRGGQPAREDQGFESRSLPRRVCELLVPNRRSPNLPLVQIARADLRRLGSRSTLSGVYAFDVITLLSWPGSAFPRFLGAEARQVGAHRAALGRLMSAGRCCDGRFRSGRIDKHRQCLVFIRSSQSRPSLLSSTALIPAFFDWPIGACSECWGGCG